MLGHVEPKKSFEEYMQQRTQLEKKNFDLAKDFQISLFFFLIFMIFCVYNLMPNSDTAEYPSKILIPFNHKKNKSFTK